MQKMNKALINYADSRRSLVIPRLYAVIVGFILILTTSISCPIVSQAVSPDVSNLEITLVDQEVFTENIEEPGYIKDAERLKEALEENAIPPEEPETRMEIEKSDDSEITAEKEEYDYSKEEADWPNEFIYYRGEILDKDLGIVNGPSGQETYYNLPMQGVLDIMRSIGFNETYWIREDGVKMFGDYIMVAANLDIYTRGSIVKTTLGLGMVCDTGTFVENTPVELDIAVVW